MLKVQAVIQTYEDRCLFGPLSFEVHPGEKVALVGPNGCGKTTLMKRIIGELTEGEGHIGYTGRLGYLPQDLSLGDVPNAMAYFDAHHVGAEHPEFAKITGQMAIADILWQPVSTLSGGEKTRVLLTQLMLTAPEVLLLDEPTNHLDTQGLQVLERFIDQYPGALLMVSHDRAFMNRTVNRILAFDSGQLRRFRGNYDHYKTLLSYEIAHQNMAHERYVKTKQQLEAAADQQMKRAHQYNGLSQNDFQRGKAKGVARTAQALRKRVEKLEVVEKPKWVRPIPLYMSTPSEAPRFLVRAYDLELAFDGMRVFKNVSFQLERGQRIALVGSNGTGKSSLLKAVLDPDFRRSWCQGELVVSKGIDIGYFSQEISDLDPNQTLMEAVQDIRLPDHERRNFLGAMGFVGDDVFKRVRLLSFGEKARVAFLKLVLGGYPLLLLDEPTNFLDIPTREKIESLLATYEGAIVFVSHDQYFIEKMAEQIWHLSADGLRKEGGYNDYDNYSSKNH